MKIFQLIIILLILTPLSALNAQDVASSNNGGSNYGRDYNFSHKIIINNAVLEDGTYSFNSKKGKVIITIKDGLYLERYPNSEFIKAKINWISEYSYVLKIINFRKAGFNYKIGAEFKSEIIDIKGNTYEYQTKLANGKTYRGKLLKLESKNSRR